MDLKFELYSSFTKIRYKLIKKMVVYRLEYIHVIARVTFFHFLLLLINFICKINFIIAGLVIKVVTPLPNK